MSDRGAHCRNRPVFAHCVAENEDCRAVASAKADLFLPCHAFAESFDSAGQSVRQRSQFEFEIPSPRRCFDTVRDIYIDCGILRSPNDLSSPRFTASNSAMQKPGSKGMNVTYAHKLLVVGDQQRHDFLKTRGRACLVRHDVKRSSDSRASFSCMVHKIVLPENAA
jgi:hypothetical protein